MKILFFKDNTRREIFCHFEVEHIILNYIINNLKFSKDIRELAFDQFKRIFIKYSVVKIKNRCLFSNRSRSVYKKFKLSRIFLKNFALQGLLIGVKKASW